MKKFEVTIEAAEGTADSERLHDAGVFERFPASGNRPAQVTERRTWSENAFRVVAGKLPPAFRAAFENAVAEIERHKVVDVFRFWAGGLEEAPMSGDLGRVPVREVEVPVEGFPATKMSVAKYRWLAGMPAGVFLEGEAELISQRVFGPS